jgi:Tfp pilus assembly protein PilN
MIEINLVPDVKQELIKAQRVRSAVISSAIVVGIVALAVVTLLVIYVFGIQAVRSNFDDGAITDGSKQLAKVEDLSKTLTIQNQLTKITTLHNSIKLDSRLFDVLNAVIPPVPNDVHISNLYIDSSIHQIKIEGQAANSYAAVEVFKKTIEGAQVNYSDGTAQKSVPLASNVSTGDTSYGEDASGAKVLRFTLTFDYASELFPPSSKNVTIKISTQGNATDSYLGVPKSIFVDRAADIGGTK